ncbi:axonemal dynein light chain domain-containing protein 1 [Latimeria chalumnae]|uniref:axonemal dynein light chain domain-containing protein 1 n=1 Tax=Latimeria chalumnae TaxID=7897 RepID=UPI00313E1F40
MAEVKVPPALPKPEAQMVKPGLLQLLSSEDTRELPELKDKSLMVDRTKPFPTSLQSDFIPQEILLALTSASESISSPEQLGPLKDKKTPKDFKSHRFRATGHVWHHPIRRNKLKHLTDQPVVMAAAGRDMSFLYDMLSKPYVKSERPTSPSQDHSATREKLHDLQKHKPKTIISESLIPEEYHLVKNKGVLGLEYYDDKYTTFLEDDESRLKVFPSLKPGGRLQVVQLMKVMDLMLKKVGADDNAEELKGPTQIHNLLELVKKEQSIYNVVFHELIRQITIDCAERGEILAKLRERYVNLLDRIPRQLKGLHNELMAQRALDRHLTEELVHFKTSVDTLTRQLSHIQQHDLKLMRDTQKAQRKLSQALIQSQKNANLLEEYHGLYELQRARLEMLVKCLTEEKDLWSKAAYNLALKVIEDNNLQLAKRLHVTEKSWVKLTHHFTILLSSKDTSEIVDMQEASEKWRELMGKFAQEVHQAEDSIKEKLKTIITGFSKWKKCFQDNIILRRDHKLQNLSQEVMQGVKEDIVMWDQMLISDIEAFGGELLLTHQETLETMSKLQTMWTSLGQAIFERHQGHQNEVFLAQGMMEELNRKLDEFYKQYWNRVAGENGVARELIIFSNSLEYWIGKLQIGSEGVGKFPENNWLKFYELLSIWIADLEKVQQLVGSPYKEEDQEDQKHHVCLDRKEAHKIHTEWITSVTNTIDTQNSKMDDEITELHLEMTHWMVKVLLYMVPDYPSKVLPKQRDDEEEEYLKAAAMVQLEERVKELIPKLERFSRHLHSCCKEIVEKMVQEKRATYGDMAEDDMRDLNKIMIECGLWAETCELLLSEIKGEAVEIWTPWSQRSGEDAFYGHESPMSEEAKHRKIERLLHPPTEELKDFHVLQEDSQTEEETLSESSQESGLSFATSMRIIGHDANVRMRSLEGETIPVGEGELTATRPETPASEKELEELTVINSLQQQLFQAEDRAQTAEERVSSLDEQLRAALENIQDLERQLQGKAVLEGPQDMLSEKKENGGN